MTSRFLLVTRIGRKSQHRRWLDGADRQFDVLLSAYDAEIPDPGGSGVTFERRPGHKVAGYDAFLRERRDLWTQYDYICLLDEDIAADTGTLNRMFRLCEAHDLKISQPALSHDSHFTYGALLRQRAWSLRYVNFVEMMCPVIRRDALERIQPLFSEGVESGIDLVWCNLVAEGERDFAVLDATPVRHTEPVGGNKAANGFAMGRRYEDDIGLLLERYDLPWLSCVPYAAVTARGRVVRSRAALFLAALELLAAVPRQRPLWPRLRSILVHLRHILTREPRNLRRTAGGDSATRAGASTIPDMPRGTAGRTEGP